MDTGHIYEYQCVKMLKRKGFTRVKVTKGSGDQGIDIIAYNRGKKYGIQCKYYSSPVGNYAVQEVFAGARYYNCDIAVVMTNNTFTKSAKELAKKTNVFLWGNNKIPFSCRSVTITEFIGTVSYILGIIMLMASFVSVEIKILVMMQFLFFICGGFLMYFERENWKLSFSASIAYLISGFLMLIYMIVENKIMLFGFEMIGFYIIFCLISFFRSDYLYKKGKNYHIWKNGFKQFVHDNFSKGEELKLESEKYMPKEESEKKLLKIEKGIEKVHNDIQKIELGLEEQRDIFEIDKELKRAKELADIVNKTIDRDTFYNSINEIKDILRKLSVYEGKVPFVGSPSTDLKNLEQIEQSQIELLERRIAEKKITKILLM